MLTNVEYDSRPDTWEHIHEVRKLLDDVAIDLLLRAERHDQSKMREPELSMFNEFRPKLDQCEHDSPEYHENLRKMGEALQHHYRENRHHPEHFENGINDMTLIDLLEMVCDWIAAAGRKGDSALPYVLDGAQQRFGYDDQLKQILANTVEALA